MPTTPRRSAPAIAAWVAVLSAISTLLLAHPLTHLLGSENTVLQNLGYFGFACSVLAPHAGLLFAAGSVPAFLWWRPRLGVACLLCAGLGAGPALGSYLPRNRVEPDGREVLRVLTLNALFDNREHQRIIEAIRAADPDLIVLEEYTAPLDAALRGALRTSHPYVFAAVRPNNRGQALYSKLPIEDPHEVSLAPGVWDAPALAATLVWNQQPIDILGVHLPSIPSREHLVQNYHSVQALAGLAGRAEHDLLVVGDFNSTPETLQHALLAEAGLRESALETGSGRAITHPLLGLPSWCEPGFRIDNVFARGSLRFVSSRVLADVGSDHRPVLVELVRPGK